jgi:hypothetical protein
VRMQPKASLALCFVCRSWCGYCPPSVIKAAASRGVLWLGQLGINLIE